MVTNTLAIWGVFCIAKWVWGLPTWWATLGGWLVLLVGVAVVSYEITKGIK